MTPQRTENCALQEEEDLSLSALEEPGLRSCMSSGSLMGMGRRKVSFAKIEIREYERSIGDGVASSGVPVSLGWEYASAGQLDLESYEKHKQPRTQSEMKLPGHVRMDLLKHAGYSLEERLEAIKKSNIERNRRRATVAKTPEMFRAEYALEKAGRTLKKAMRRKTSDSKKGQKIDKQEIENLIRRDRRRAKNREQVRRNNSCPTLLDLAEDETSSEFEARHSEELVLEQADDTNAASEQLDHGDSSKEITAAGEQSKSQPTPDQDSSEETQEPQQLGHSEELEQGDDTDPSSSPPKEITRSTQQLRHSDPGTSQTTWLHSSIRSDESDEWFVGDVIDS